MKYPNWIEDIEARSIFIPAGTGFFRLLQMAKDAWALAYLAGTGVGMTLEDFCAKYGDEPANEIPTLELPIPNDGSPV